METCRNGHVRTPENTYVYARTGARQCRECAVAWRRSRGIEPRGQARFCLNGLHEFTPENTYWDPKGIRRCRECSRESDRKRFIRDRERRNAYNNAAYNALPLVERKNRRLRAQFGLTLGEYSALLAEQGGVCAICGGNEPGGRWNTYFSVDHDRRCCPGAKSCGKCRRGLLCGHCNVLLGNAKEREDVLHAAVKYLDHWRTSPPS